MNQSGATTTPEQAAIRDAACQLAQAIDAASTNAADYAENVMLALDAFGIDVPAGIKPMITNAILQGWQAGGA